MFLLSLYYVAKRKKAHQRAEIKNPQVSPLLLDKALQEKVLITNSLIPKSWHSREPIFLILTSKK
jgi:hypothetical protein